VARTTINVDRDALRRAGEALGTTGASATVNAALREAARRRALADFDVRRDIDGRPAEVAQGRASRAADEG
jgi:Arc/MetJ family transcription regulator